MKIKNLVSVIVNMLLLVLVMLIGLTRYRPEFFDIFGLFIFLFLFVLGGWMLYSDRKMPNWAAVIVLLIGLMGLVVDGWIVIRTYLLGG